MLTIQNQRKRSIHDLEEDRGVEDVMTKRTCSVVPDFECSAYYLGQVKPLRLSTLLDQYNTVILFFYEGDFTPQALRDVESIMAHYNDFLTKGALPVMISTDSAMVHYGFCSPTTPGGLTQPPPFPMFGDIARFISRHFDTLDLSTGNARRAVFVLNQERHIQYAYLPMKDIPFSIPSILYSLSRIKHP